MFVFLIKTIVVDNVQLGTDFLMKSTDRHKLVITGQDKTPVEITECTELK